MEKIAIIGLGCLFPGAKNPAEYWRNLMGARDTTSLATAAEMGVDPDIFFDPRKGATDRYYSPDVTEPPFVLGKNSTIAVPEETGIGVTRRTL